MSFGALGTLGSFNRLGAGGDRLTGFIPGAALDLRYDRSRYLLNGGVYGSPVSVPNLAFTRSGARTATGSDGTVYDYATGVRRIVPGDGLRVTAGAVNLLKHSEDFSNAAWSTTNITVSSDGTTIAGMSASKIEVTAAAVTLVFQEVAGAGSATGNTYSIFVAKGSGATQANRFLLRNHTTSTNLIDVTINYDTGVITGSGATSQAVDGGWRLALTATSGISNGDALRCYIGFIGGSEAAGDHLYAAGAQLNTGGLADYIPTTTASASAGADAETFDLGLAGGVWTNLGGLDPSAGFTVLVEAVRPLGSAANVNLSVLAALRSGTSVTDRIQLYNINGGEGLFIESGDVAQAALVSGEVTAAGESVKIAARITTDNVGISANGSVAIADASVTLPDFTGMTLNVGAASNTGGQPVNGFIRRIAIIPGAYSDAQLQAWSGS